MTAQQLAGEVALVTGAAGDIGAVFARALAEAGACVVLADLNGSGAQAQAEALEADGLKALGVAMDVSSEESVASAFAAAMSHFGTVSILVNAAALMKEIPTMDPLALDLAWWNRVLDVNLTGPLRTIRAAVPHMQAAGRGKIVNITSGGAFIPSGAYGVSKLGLVSLTTTLAKQLGSAGINVNAIAPGHMNTSSGHEARHHDDAIVAALDHVVPLKTLGEAQDLVGGLLFLCSSQSDWVTGQTLSIDGGWIMRL
jgi:NAD(P)-dependent dehydrogenase (short-subunit alcohol dehydrogenase family)